MPIDRRTHGGFIDFFGDERIRKASTAWDHIPVVVLLLLINGRIGGSLSATTA
jgi:hypothetical protein